MHAAHGDAYRRQRAADVYVLRLRQKMEKVPAAPILIHSVRGFWYTFEPRRAMAAVQGWPASRH